MFIREKEVLGESARNDDVHLYIKPLLSSQSSGSASLLQIDEVIEDRCVPYGEECLELKPKTVTLFG